MVTVVVKVVGVVISEGGSGGGGRSPRPEALRGTKRWLRHSRPCGQSDIKKKTGRIKTRGRDHNAIGHHSPALTSVATCTNYHQGGVTMHRDCYHV